MSEKIIIKKTTVVPSTVKVTGKKGERVIGDGKWIVGLFTNEGAFMTGAEYMKATGDVDGKYGRDWAKREYAVHYAAELADREKAGMSKAVADEREGADAAWKKAEGEREAAAKWRKEHKSEANLEALKKRADAVAKACKKDSAVKGLADATSSKADKMLTILRSDMIVAAGKVTVDDALAFIASKKEEAKSAKEESAVA